MRNIGGPGMLNSIWKLSRERSNPDEIKMYTVVVVDECLSLAIR